MLFRSGTVAIRNYEAWQDICLNMDTITVNQPVDTSYTFFGQRYELPVFAGPVGAVKLHYGDKLTDLAYNDILVPGNRAGLRPDRAVIVYANKIQEVFGDIPLMIGGLEASLRRFAHYDYWEDKVRRSILFDAQADILTYGMGERASVEILSRLASGTQIGRAHV